MLLANAATLAGNTSAARSAYDRATRLHTDDPEAYLNLGILLYNEGDVNGGIRMVQNAIARDTMNVLSAFTLGRMYQDGAQDPEAALAWFTRTLNLDSGHTEARGRSAECLQSLTKKGPGPHGNHRSAP
jgi:cytochrome c-type biogenesis protein CcmH/NrfG